MNITYGGDDSTCGCSYRFKDYGRGLTLIMARCVEHEGLDAGYAVETHPYVADPRDVD